MSVQNVPLPNGSVHYQGLLKETVIHFTVVKMQW